MEQVSTVSFGGPLTGIDDLAGLMAPAGAKVELLDGCAVMTSRRDEPFTRAHLDALPDDGRRHELIDGAIFVTPSPTPRHQSISMAMAIALAIALAESCPDHLAVFAARCRRPTCCAEGAARRNSAPVVVTPTLDA